MVLGSLGREEGVITSTKNSNYQCPLRWPLTSGSGKFLALALCFLSLFWKSVGFSTMGDLGCREQSITAAGLVLWSQIRGWGAPSLLCPPPPPSEPSRRHSSSAVGNISVLFCLRTKSLVTSRFKRLHPRPALVYQPSVRKQISPEDSITIRQK